MLPFAKHLHIQPNFVDLAAGDPRSAFRERYARDSQG
jgi:hypothetical protein